MNDILDSQDSFGDLFKWHEELQRKLNPLKDIIDSSNSLVKNITPNIDFGNNIFDSALYQYGLELQSIVEKFNNPILPSFNNIQELANEFIEEKQKAENNYYHNLVVEEYTQENEQYKQRNVELEQQVKDLEATLRTLYNIVPQPAKEQKYTSPLSLKPNITPSQIVYLHESLKNIFEATLEQWKSLFSEKEINLLEPIKGQAPADIAILLHYLKENELIEVSKYPSIIERTKAFSIDGKTVSAKQINKVKNENFNFPNIGKHYIKIQSVIESL